MRLNVAILLLLLPLCLAANVNLDLRPDSQTVHVGDTVSLDLYAGWDGNPGQLMAAMDVIMLWNPAYLNPISYTIAGAGYGWYQAGFLYPGGLNGSLWDGDAIWTCFAAPGNPAVATPSGLRVCTFRFQAVGPTNGTAVSIPRTLGGYTTVVYDGTQPNTDITGTLDPGAVVTIIQTAPVHGHVALEAYSAGAGIGATLEFRQPSTTNVLYSAPITLDGSGNYTAPSVPVGTYDVAVKFLNWLRQVVPNVTVAAPAGAAVDFAPSNGDAYADNSVNLLDLGVVLGSFGVAATPPSEGDVNWDGSVNLLDLGVVLANFGMHGDP